MQELNLIDIDHVAGGVSSTGTAMRTRMLIISPALRFVVDPQQLSETYNDDSESAYPHHQR